MAGIFRTGMQSGTVIPPVPPRAQFQPVSGHSGHSGRFRSISAEIPVLKLLVWVSETFQEQEIPRIQPPISQPPQQSAPTTQMSNIQAAHSPPSQVAMQDQTGASQIPPNRKQHQNQTVMPSSSPSSSSSSSSAK
ncbi:hypothetical protein SO802_017053 [Lithocarpus litseifolius]|uniref:Uncharacterized protein n=1 Tax=Lithocarpus litseifolius TaxID=425828 RepID=A0AAW2D0B8_9ROSI